MFVILKENLISSARIIAGVIRVIRVIGGERIITLVPMRVRDYPCGLNFLRRSASTEVQDPIDLPFCFVNLQTAAVLCQDCGGCNLIFVSSEPVPLLKTQTSPTNSVMYPTPLTCHVGAPESLWHSLFGTLDHYGPVWDTLDLGTLGQGHSRTLWDTLGHYETGLWPYPGDRIRLDFEFCNSAVTISGIQLKQCVDFRKVDRFPLSRKSGCPDLGLPIP